MMYEPRIIAFLCSWCSYTGADTAGIARIKYPANIRAVRVPCSGRVSPELVMRTFDEGADGVLILGCHIGECHYDTGNHRAAKRIPILNSLMAFAGLEPARLRLDWVSASEGERFSRIATEFTEAVRSLGPINWRHPVLPGLAARMDPITHLAAIPVPDDPADIKTNALRAKASELLVSGKVSCVIGYEPTRRGGVRSVFVRDPANTERLVWNSDCSPNLTTYLPAMLRSKRGKEPPKPVAVVVKPCDSKTINVQLAEGLYQRSQVHAIAVTCNGVRDIDNNLQPQCVSCQEVEPVVADTVIGEPVTKAEHPPFRQAEIATLNSLNHEERMAFWLDEFDRCIRCYACRQACPLCNCPECLYERDDLTFIGHGLRLDEKRTFHLGRAYHLAGRCVGCNECERACPQGIHLSYLNQMLASEISATFHFSAGRSVEPSPIVTVLSGEYKES
jgi:coenzyme F420-reducing hydrogenase delta subunit/ferredoxin